MNLQLQSLTSELDGVKWLAVPPDVLPQRNTLPLPIECEVRWAVETIFASTKR
jgi:hypothetical protein